MAAILACVMLASSIPEAVLGVQLRASIQAERKAGSNAFVVSSTKGPILSSECLALEANPGVLAAGVLSTSSIGSTQAAPRTPFQVVWVSPGFLDVLAPARRSHKPGVYFGPAVVDEIPHTDHQPVEIATRPVGKLEGVLSVGMRDQDLARWVFIAGTPERSAAECWVEARPGFVSQLQSMIPSAFTHESKFSIRAVHPNNEQSLLASWKNRPTQFSGLVGGALVGMFLAFVTWGRRNEYALLSILGVCRTEIALIANLQAFVPIGLALPLAAPWIGVFQLVSGGDELPARLGLTQLVLTYGLSSLIVFTFSWTAGRGDVAMIVKNRD